MRTILLHSYSSNSLANISRDANNTTKSDFYSSDDIFDISGNPDGKSNKKPSSGLALVTSLVSKNLLRKKLLHKKLPILDWSKDYNWQKFLADLIAGITIGLTILPQGLAYAQIAGLPPQVINSYVHKLVNFCLLFTFHSILVWIILWFHGLLCLPFLWKD